MRRRFRKSSRSVVITGAGCGLGREIALGLAAKRYIVFGTAASAREVKELREASKGRVSLAVCDLRTAVAVDAWAQGISEALGNSGLDVLINNAAHAAPGPVELVSPKDVRKGFEVNVFGAVAAINAFLPALRNARGLIVQVSSWTLDTFLHFDGVSGASQAAMEVFSAAYRAELKPFGIEVIVASIGNLDGVGPQASAALAQIDHGMTAGQRKLYGRRLRARVEMLARLSPRSELATAATRVIALVTERDTSIGPAPNARASL